MDMETLMAQAQALQTKVADAQEQLARTSVKGLAANGACIVEMSGKYDILNLTIRDEVLAQGATQVSEIVLSALRDAKAKADTLIDQVMSAATAGVPMPN